MSVPAGEPTLESARDALARGDRELAERELVALVSRTPADAEAWRLAASLALERGDAPGAMQRLTKALAADPRNDEAWADLGRLYLQLERPDQTREAMLRALTIAPQRAAHWHLAGMAQLAEGNVADAVDALRQALARSDATPRHRTALAAALLDAGDADAALVQARQAAADAPADAQAHFVLGTVLAAQRQHREAAAAFAAAAARDPHSAQAHYNRALALDEAGETEAAVAACDAALVIDPALWAALAQRVFMQRRLCDWRELAVQSARLANGVRDGAPGITPFSFLAEPATPAEQLACARTHAHAIVAHAGAPLHPAFSHAAAGEAPRVGFVSSGFNNHPTALLLAELVERLRDSPLRVAGYATASDDGGAMRRRMRAAFAGFHEVHDLAPRALAERIRADRIDVLFDLRGYGAGAVSAAFALRPAPVQVNWLAYPGTSGAPFIDYLFADASTVPPAQRAHYSESVVRLPHCFQPSDSTRPVAEPPPRAQLGLPERGVVFASFNNSYKINPEVFGAWLRILADVPGSALWLLGPPDGPAARNLREAAAAGGVAPQRLVFQPKLAHDAYLALYRHVDLFLDTWPYGAHTTASDALWAGAPLLSLPGDTFAARVGLSLLHALGLQALVASDVDDYVARAVRMANQPGLLASLRQRLELARRDSPLFDMRRFARDFARAVQAVHARARDGLPPADIDIAHA
jgi:predicted O-linked N-acetylglucosamine transferase (SPINDLY family)